MTIPPPPLPYLHHEPGRDVQQTSTGPMGMSYYALPMALTFATFESTKSSYPSRRPCSKTCSTSPNLCRQPRASSPSSTYSIHPATEYHRLILLHARYRNEVEVIASSTQRSLRSPAQAYYPLAMPGQQEHVMQKFVLEAIRRSPALDYKALAHAFKTYHGLDAETVVLESSSVPFLTEPTP